MLLSSLLLCADPSSLPVSVPSSCRKPGLGVRKWSSCLSLFPDGLCDGRILSSYSSDLLHFVLFEEKRETRFCYLSKALSVDRTVWLMQWANGLVWHRATHLQWRIHFLAWQTPFLALELAFQIIAQIPKLPVAFRQHCVCCILCFRATHSLYSAPSS